MNTHNYKWNSEDYLKNSAAQYQWAQELIGKLNLKGDETVLDLGCGDGKITALIAEQLPNGAVTGIDSSASMIALARETFPVETHPNLSFIHMDATEIDLPTTYDIAFSNAALHWTPDHDAVLTGIHNHLKPSGRILLQMGGKGNAADILDIANDMIQHPPWVRYFEGFEFPYSFFSDEEYGALLDASGFKARRIELIPKDMIQQGKEGLAGWMRTTWMPYIERVPEEQQETFVNEIIDHYLREFPLDDNGQTHVQMVRLEVEAILKQSSIIGKPRHTLNVNEADSIVQ